MTAYSKTNPDFQYLPKQTFETKMSQNRTINLNLALAIINIWTSKNGNFSQFLRIKSLISTLKHSMTENLR